MLSRVFVLVSGLWLIGAANAGGPADAARLAAEERMLSQRIVKAYAQIGLGVMPALASAQLTDAVRRFDANLERLRATVEGEPASALDRLIQRWEALKAATAVPPSRESALRMSEQSVAALDAAGELIARVAGRPGGDTAEPVRLARQARMLSQRVAKAYMLQSWGGPVSSLRDEVAAAAAEFSANLAALTGRAESNAAIRQELDELALQWQWLSTALATEGAVPYRLVVAEAADSILASADRLERLYQQLDGETPASVRSEK